MAQVYEFVNYIDFEKLRKELEKRVAIANRTNNPKDIAKSLETSNELMQLRRKLKYNLGYDENTFKYWLNANNEFIKVLSKQERAMIKSACEAFESERYAEEINNLFELLYSVNYPTFIDEYLEDYSI